MQSKPNTAATAHVRYYSDGTTVVEENSFLCTDSQFDVFYMQTEIM